MSRETFKKRIADVNWAYKHSNKNRLRIPDTDILAYLKKNISDFDRFMVEVFFPFRGFEYDSYQLRLKMRRKKANKVSVTSTPLNRIDRTLPCIISVPCFEEAFHGDFSKWLESTKRDQCSHMDSTIEDNADFELNDDKLELENDAEMDETSKFVEKSTQANLCSCPSLTMLTSELFHYPQTTSHLSV